MEDGSGAAAIALPAAVALVVALLLGGGLWLGGVATCSSRPAPSWWWHRAVLLGALPLAVIATFILATVPATVAGYVHAASSGGAAEPLLVGPWLRFLAQAGVLAVGEGDRASVNASFDMVRDVLAVHLALVVAYAGNVVLWQLGTTLRLLRAGRRISFTQRQAQFRQR